MSVLVCFCFDLRCNVFPRLLSLIPNMPWHAVWLPFDFNLSVCVCVGKSHRLLSRDVCLINVWPMQLDGISWGFSLKCCLSFSLPLMCPIFSSLSSMFLSPKRTHRSLWLVTVLREVLVTACVHQLANVSVIYHHYMPRSLLALFGCIMWTSC